jgi:hypothetical protein
VYRSSKQLFKCERVSRLGPTVQFLIAITDQGEFPQDHAKDIAHSAANQNRLAVLVSNSGGLILTFMFYALVSEMVTHHFFSGGAPGSPKTMPSWTPFGSGYTLLEPVQLNMIALRRK